MQGHICEAAKAKYIAAAKYGQTQRTIKFESHKNALKVVTWKCSPGNTANFMKCKSTERNLMAVVIGCSLRVLGQQLCGTDLLMSHILQLLDQGYCCCRLIKGLKSDHQQEAECCKRSESSQCNIMMWSFKYLSQGFFTFSGEVPNALYIQEHNIHKHILLTSDMPLYQKY